MSTIKGLSALLCQLAYLVGELFPMDSRSLASLKLLLRFSALTNSSLAPPRNPPEEHFIAQPVTDIFQPLAGALPFQTGERFLQWHILAQCSQFAEKQRLSPVLRQALGQARRAAGAQPPGLRICGDRLEVLVFCKHGRRGFFTPARDAGEAVGRIAHQPQPVGD